MKRYLRIDIEYDDSHPPNGYVRTVSINTQRIIREDMPYVMVKFVRDVPTREMLDEPVYRGRPK